MKEITVKPEFLRAWECQPQHLGREENLSTMAPVTWIMSHGSLGKIHPQLLYPRETQWPLAVQSSPASLPRFDLWLLVHRNGGLL